MKGKNFVAVTLVLYFSSLVSYYSQIKIIDIYGLQVKYYFDLYFSYLQITITLVILGLPNAISLMVVRDKEVPNNIKTFSFVCAILSSVILNYIFLDGNMSVLILLFLFVFVSLFNDLNTGVMNSIGMFEYPRVWLLVGNLLLLFFVFLEPLSLIAPNVIKDSEYALIFIILPVLPLFLILNISNKFKGKALGYRAVSLTSVFKYVNYIYFFSILSILMTRLPYINYSIFADKFSLAQFTLSISLSNFIVIPLNVIALKVLSSDSNKKINVFVVNLLLLSIVLISSVVLYYVSSKFELISDLTNISSSDILVSTFLVVSILSISSINLSLSLRFQNRVKSFLFLDVIVVFFLFILTKNYIAILNHLSDYNYTIALFVLLKLLIQIFFLREQNVYNSNCKLQ